MYILLPPPPCICGCPHPDTRAPSNTSCLDVFALLDMVSQPSSQTTNHRQLQVTGWQPSFVSRQPSAMTQSDTTTQDTPPCHSDGPADTAACSGSGPDPEKAGLAPSSAPMAPALEKWNQPSVNRNRYFATVLGLTVMGLNDACLGALIPYVRARLSLCSGVLTWSPAGTAHDIQYSTVRY